MFFFLSLFFPFSFIIKGLNTNARFLLLYRFKRNNIGEQIDGDDRLNLPGDRRTFKRDKLSPAPLFLRGDKVSTRLLRVFFPRSRTDCPSTTRLTNEFLPSQSFHPSYSHPSYSLPLISPSLLSTGRNILRNSTRYATCSMITFSTRVGIFKENFLETTFPVGEKFSGRPCRGSRSREHRRRKVGRNWK